MGNLQNWAKNFNRNLIAAFATILTLTLVGIIIYTLFPENLDINYIQNTFAYKLSFFVDEKSERLTYIIDTLLFIPLFLLAYSAVKKYIKIKDDIKLLNNFSALGCIFIILFLFIMVPLSLHFGLNMSFAFISAHIFEIILFLLLAVLCFFIKDKKIFESKIFLITSLLFLAVYILKTLYFYPTHIVNQTFMEAYHFEFFVYPIFKLEQGLLPGVDFINIYGFYPYFYAILSLLGPISTYKITFMTAIITAVSWCCGIYYIYKITENKFFAFLLSLVFMYFVSANWSYYLQFIPLRIIAFSILLFLATLYMQKQKNYLIFLGFFVSVLAMVWNFETGLVNLIAWTAFVAYNLFSTYTVKDKKLYSSVIKIIIYALISLAIALLSFKFIPYIWGGKTADLSNIFLPQTLYLNSGFMVARISPMHPWFLPLLIYVTALILVLQPVCKAEKTQDRELPLLVFLSIFGLGIYTYYQGRSFFENLMGVFFPALLILPVLIQKMLDKIKDLKTKETENIRNLFQFINFAFFTFVAFMAVFVIYCVFIINTPKITHYKNEMPLQEKSKYLAELIQDKKPLIFTLYSAYYYEALGRKDNFPQAAPVDFFVKTDYKNLFDYLEKTHTPLVLDDEQFTRLKLYYTDKFKDFINKTTHKKSDEFILFEFK